MISNYHSQKMKFFIKDLFSKCDQIRRKPRIRSHLLKKSLMENFIFCAVYDHLACKSIVTLAYWVFEWCGRLKWLAIFANISVLVFLWLHHIFEGYILWVNFIVQGLNNSFSKNRFSFIVCWIHFYIFIL